MIFLLFLNLGDLYVNEFMEVGVGARALGMGNAFVGLANDVSAFYWNPAGLTQLENPELFLMYSDNFESVMSTSTASFVYPAKSYTIAISAYWLQVAGIPLTDTTGGTVRDTGSINASDFVVYLSYAHPFASFNIGVNVKGLYRDWGVGSGYGFQTDVGILSKLGDVAYGFNIVNLIGTPIYFSDNVVDTIIKDTLSPIIKSGISFTECFSDATLNISIGLDTSFEEKVTEFSSLHTDTHLGAEYVWKNQFALRAGRDKGIFNAGCGLIYEAIKLDYALQFHPDLGVVKRLSGSIYF